MRSALQNPVPSSNLLKFLKLQSEGICFFSPNPRYGFIFDIAAPQGPQVRLRAGKGSRRCLSTANPQHTTIEAGFLNVDLLWPRSAPLTRASKSSRDTGIPRGFKHGGVIELNRSASTRSPKWHERLWGVRSKKGGKALHPDDLPRSLHGLEDGDDSIFSKVHSISAKAAAQPKLRCTELDENGNVVLASGEFKKSELIAKVPPPPHRVTWECDANYLIHNSTGFSLEIFEKSIRVFFHTS
jgi:magnesium transporter